MAWCSSAITGEATGFGGQAAELITLPLRSRVPARRLLLAAVAMRTAIATILTCKIIRLGDPD